MSRKLFALAAMLLGSAWTTGPVNDSTVATPVRWEETSLLASISQGFNLQKEAQDNIGHINSLKIGDTEMSSDLNVTDPMQFANHVKVFGVASSIHWKGAYADPVYFSAQVSVENKNKLATLLHKSMANTEVEVQFTFCSWDPQTKVYYQSLHTNAVEVKGLVLKQGGELAMNIAMDRSAEVVSPKYHRFTMGVMPQDTDMQLHLAFSSTAKLAKK